ncbi:hypothetical protein FW778_14370 [Ginsengibacter hankyongi]|uniref:Uncharacterized protein n=1 Tax=Ginsengibacter hankyongi TaxID=2607284 RepID=A0A5J5IIZ6_9BACT|nr:hypothetical protein [Ginsengibacter hankyongi]KAA9038727.1 hypothetical protein FW778_14370 [Ginsengibacter hankyongi]
MAILINGLLKGRLGNNIYFIKNGKNFSRPVRKVANHSEAQLARQQLFAKAGKMCKTLHKDITDNITLPERHLVYPRLMSCMLHVVRGLDINLLTTGNCTTWFAPCKFNSSFSVKERWHVNFELVHAANGLLQLQIPTYNPTRELNAPAHTHHVQCNILATGCDVNDGTPTGSYATVLTIDYTDAEIPAQVTDLAIPTPPGSLILLCMSLEYVLYGRGAETINRNPRYMPSGVTAAILV